MNTPPNCHDDVLFKAQSGDSAAFAIIVRTQQRSVFSLALRMVSDRHKAEDLAQETFLQLHRKLTSIQSAAHLAFWLRQVVMRKAIDALRRQPRNEVELSEAADQAQEYEDGDVLLGQRLVTLLAQLSGDARAVMLLRYQEDLEPTEIARVLQMSINTVKSHLKRSLAFLRTHTDRGNRRATIIPFQGGKTS